MTTKALDSRPDSAVSLKMIFKILNEGSDRPREREEERPCEDLRCLCGRLVAKLVTGGIELKCGRCHRIVLVPFEDVTVEEPAESG
jgi:phage FluMu protein Com